MTLRLVYRLYGGENFKGRPSFYSKATCLASFLRAAEVVQAQVTVLADGPIPDELRRMVDGRGRILDLPGGPLGMRASYVSALKLPRASDWPDDDLVYFSEDDYLHDDRAFVALQAAQLEIAGAEYFALYASTPQHIAFPPGVDVTEPADFRRHADAQVQGHAWVNVPSTASTFGATVGALKADYGIFRQGMFPYRHRLLDHETCLVYQGRFPYSLKEIAIGPAATRFRSGLPELAANCVQAPFRVAYDLRALTRRRHPHLLYAADPNLACHLETEFMSPGVDWAEHARAAVAWANEAGYAITARPREA